MSNRFYDPGDQRAARVNELFGAIAPRYDLINDLQSLGLHRCWKRRLVRLAEPRTGQLALDLCCGTGDVALAFARQGVGVIGLDFNEHMLAVANRRMSRLQADVRWNPGEPFPGARFIRADGQRIPFPDSHFDVVTISYGLRNLASWETGLREMWRVVKPRGRVLVLDFGKPPNALWRSLYFSYLKLVVPVFGRLFFGDAQTHGYILESLIHFPAQEGVAAAMRALPFTDVRVVNLLGGIMGINYAVKAG